MILKDSSPAADLHDYWLQTVLEDRAESAPPPRDEPTDERAE